MQTFSCTLYSFSANLKSWPRYRRAYPKPNTVSVIVNRVHSCWECGSRLGGRSHAKSRMNDVVICFLLFSSAPSSSSLIDGLKDGKVNDKHKLDLLRKGLPVTRKQQQRWFCLLLILLFVQIYSQTYKRQQQITRASQNKQGKCKDNHTENNLRISNVMCFYRQISSCNVM